MYCCHLRQNLKINMFFNLTYPNIIENKEIYIFIFLSRKKYIIYKLMYVSRGQKKKTLAGIGLQKKTLAG